MPIHRKIRKRPVLVVLRSERFTCRFEMIEILFGPPIGQSALGVELTTLIVEAVTDFMTDHSSDRAVVMCGIGAGIEERRLQNRGRKIKRVLQWKIDGIH